MECVYAGDKRKNPAIKAQVKELEKKLAVLEQKVAPQPSSSVVPGSDISPAPHERNSSTNKMGNTPESGLHLDELGEVRYFGASSNIGIIERPSISAPVSGFRLRSNPARSSCTRLYDSKLVEELLNLYFAWQHPYYLLFDRALFVRDMKNGGKFYSDLLLNSILVHASHLSQRPELRTIHDDPKTAGQCFYDEAKHLLDIELDSGPSLTTVQAAIILGSREAGIGENSRGWLFSGMALRIALDLGLHLDCNHIYEMGLLTDEDMHVRKITFWGCYLFDRGWSAYMGRPTLIPADAITVSRPDVCFDNCLWTADSLPAVAVQQHLLDVFNTILDINSILGRIIDQLYQSKKKGTTECVGMLHGDLCRWEASLPKYMIFDPNATFNLPSVLTMHLYQAAVILLHRPFITQPKLPYAQAICLAAAEKLINIVWYYKDRFGLRTIPNVFVYTLFTASTVLLNADLAHSSRDTIDKLEFIVTALEEICVSWASAELPLHGIVAFLRQRGYHLPFMETSFSIHRRPQITPEPLDVLPVDESYYLYNYDMNLDFLLGTGLEDLTSHTT